MFLCAEYVVYDMSDVIHNIIFWSLSWYLQNTKIIMMIIIESYTAEYYLYCHYYQAFHLQLPHKDFFTESCHNKRHTSFCETDVVMTRFYKAMIHNFIAIFMIHWFQTFKKMPGTILRVSYTCTKENCETHYAGKTIADLH